MKRTILNRKDLTNNNSEKKKMKIQLWKRTSESADSGKDDLITDKYEQESSGKKDNSRKEKLKKDASGKE